MHLELTSSRYCRSPLVQGGLEVACHITIETPATMLHQKLLKQYLKLVADILYTLYTQSQTMTQLSKAFSKCQRLCHQPSKT